MRRAPRVSDHLLAILYSPHVPQSFAPCMAEGRAISGRGADARPGRVHRTVSVASTRWRPRSSGMRSTKACFYTSFILALTLNVVAVVEGIWRFRHLGHQRAQSHPLVVMTAVPGVLAFAVRVGVPAISRLGGSAVNCRGSSMPRCRCSSCYRFAMTLRSRFIAYSRPASWCAQHQYALARKTLTVIAVLPAAALLASLIRQRDMTLGSIVTARHSSIRR